MYTLVAVAALFALTACCTVVGEGDDRRTICTFK